MALLAAVLGDWWWGLSTDLVTLSKRASEILGIPEHPPTTVAMLENAVANREHYDAEYRVDRPDGTRVWISAKGRAHYDRSGAPVRMYGVVQDITGRKIMEEDLRRHLARLAEADQRKDDFIALLAHELRNPLAPIRTGLEIIRHAPPDSILVGRILEMADRQVALMARLIDDLLDVSRNTKGKLSLRIERVIIANVVQDALELVRPQMDTAGLQVVTSLPPEDAAVDGDPIRLTQVFGNILTNSVKFTEAGGKLRFGPFYTTDISKPPWRIAV